jgi:hypothetical protein
VQQVTGTFSFQNVGDEPLVLKKPSTSCGCTVASVKPERLQPGEKGELTFQLSVTPSQQMKVEKHIFLSSNDSRNTNMVLVVQAMVLSFYEFQPDRVDLGELPMEAVTNTVIQVRRTDGGELGTIELRPSASLMGTRWTTLGAGTNEAMMMVSMKAVGEARWFYERVGLWPAGATQEVGSVSVSGRIVGEVVLSREEIYWAVVDRSQPGTRSIRARFADAGRTLEIKNLACSLKEVKLTIQRTTDGRGYEIVAQLEKVTGPFTKGVITFETNSTRQPKVTVPISINVLRR